jgi:FOG: Ankyrin repeat
MLETSPPSCSTLKIMPFLFQSGLTPLHVASFMGCMNIVIYLLQHDASPDVPTVRGETPLHLAARANQTDIIRILLRNGAQVDARARVSGLLSDFYTITNPTHNDPFLHIPHAHLWKNLSACFSSESAWRILEIFFTFNVYTKNLRWIEIRFDSSIKDKVSKNSTFILSDIGNTDNFLKCWLNYVFGQRVFLSMNFCLSTGTLLDL